MHPNAPLKDMQQHRPAVRAVMNDRIGVPNASDAALAAAEEAGLIKFKSWPSGHWSLTSLGSDLMTDY